MGWSNGFIAVDWGTTNRRAYRLDADGQCLEEFEDPKGVLAVAAGGFPAAAGEIRERLGDLPLLLAGMVGSTRGWVEAPYVPCPASLKDLAAHLCWIEPNRTAIVPGLSSTVGGDWDVMRGEEIQLFGAIASGLIPPTALVCHPGTHNKWIIVEHGKIGDFQTVMTGEMFSLLKSQAYFRVWAARSRRESFPKAASSSRTRLAPICFRFGSSPAWRSRAGRTPPLCSGLLGLDIGIGSSAP